MIQATTDDQAQIDAYLAKHFASGTMPRANLRQFGMSGGNPLAMQFWIEREDGEITDVLGRSEFGTVHLICPNHRWDRVRAALAGRSIRGVIGEAGEVAAFREATNLVHRAEFESVEPRFILDLEDLSMPAMDGHALCALDQIDISMAVAWRAAFCVESGICSLDQAIDTGKRDVSTQIADDTHRCLTHNGTPVCVTGFNAILPDVVQIGGVFTPPENRGRGYARVAVALHLGEARCKGASNSVLWARTPAACRAYEAIGFQRHGDFSVVAYADSQVIHG